MMNQTNDYDVIVLGVGAAGSAATYHLAKQDAKVLGLEQFNIPNNNGSSRGFTRVINPAVREKSQYVPIIERALELWYDLQEAHSSQLIRRTGALRGWPSRDHVGYRDTLDQAIQLCEENDLRYEVLTADEVEERYRGYDLHPDYRFLLQPDGGLLDAQECIIAHMNQAHAQGAVIKAQERVEEWKTTSEGVLVRTNKDEYTADELVITAGPWVSALVDGFEDVSPKRAVMGWFRPTQPEKFTQETFPAFGMDTEDGYFYGTPAHRIDGVKIGGTTDLDSSTVVNPDEMDRTVSSAEEEDLRRFLTEYFPDAAGPTLRLTSCMITSSSDNQYVLDTHPDHPEVHVAGGFSGSGFMTASAVGEIVTDLALEGATEFDLDPFRVSRL